MQGSVKHGRKLKRKKRYTKVAGSRVSLCKQITAGVATILKSPLAIIIILKLRLTFLPGLLKKHFSFLILKVIPKIFYSKVILLFVVNPKPVNFDGFHATYLV